MAAAVIRNACTPVVRQIALIDAPRCWAGSAGARCDEQGARADQGVLAIAVSRDGPRRAPPRRPVRTHIVLARGHNERSALMIARVRTTRPRRIADGDERFADS